MSGKSAKADPILEKHLKRALPIAVEAAMKGGGLIRRKFGRYSKLMTKLDTSLVTEVDQGSEKLVIGHLRKHFPNDHIVGEEGGLNEGQHVSSFRWHVDPLDGTTNFVHGFPFFCVSIGLEYEQRDLVLGAVYQPMTGDLYTGFKNGGAFRNKRRLKVSTTRKLADSLLSTGFSIRKEQYFETEISTLARITHRSHAVRRTGSAALDIIHVSTGQFDGFWERGLSSWDVAGGLSILSEAGGMYSRVDGKAFRIGDDSILASNGLIHRELVRACMAEGSNR